MDDVPHYPACFSSDLILKVSERHLFQAKMYLSGDQNLPSNDHFCSPYKQDSICLDSEWFTTSFSRPTFMKHLSDIPITFSPALLCSDTALVKGLLYRGQHGHSIVLLVWGSSRFQNVLSLISSMKTLGNNLIFLRGFL